MRAMFTNHFSSLVVSLIRCIGVVFELTQVLLFFFHRIQTQHSQTQLHEKDCLFFVKEMLVAPLVTAGVCVCVDVPQELQMMIGPQEMEDVEEQMSLRPSTLKDPGTLYQIVLDQHSLTHFPSQPLCEVCVESRGRDSPHREQSIIDAVVPQLQFDYGCMGDGGPLQTACSS